MIRLLLFSIFSSIIIFSCTGSTTSEVTEPEATHFLKDLRLKTLDGDDIDIDSLKDRIVFINFWATWCRPCIREMASIEMAQKKLNKDSVAFLLVSNEPRSRIKKFTESHDYNFNYLQLDMPLEQLNIQGLPTTFILNRRGLLMHTEMGARDWSTNESRNIILNAGVQP